MLATDIRTIITFLFVGNLAALPSLASYRSRGASGRPLRQFLLGKLLQAVAWLLLGLRDQIPDLFSVHVGNGFLFTGFALEALAVVTAVRPSPRLERALAVVTAASILVFWFAGDTPSGRVALASLATIAPFGVASARLLRGGLSSRLRFALGLFYAAFCLALAARVGLALYWPEEVGLLTPHPIQTMSFLVLFVLLMVGSVGFLLMLKERDDEALAESESKYRTLVEKVDEAIVIVQDRRIVFANPRLSERLGVPVRSLPGRSFFDLVWPDDRALVMGNYERRVQGEDPADGYDFRLVGPAGAPIWVVVRASRVTWDGRPAALVIMTDIDARKRLETERERIIADLERALAQVETLRGLLPICSSCKKIRDDDGHWNPVERYIRERSQAEFSHGICPDCARQIYGELVDESD